MDSNLLFCIPGLMFLPIILIWVFYCIIGITVISLYILWIVMLLDVIKRDFKNENDKMMWIVILALTQIVGAIIYFFMVKSADKKK